MPPENHFIAKDWLQRIFMTSGAFGHATNFSATVTGPATELLHWFVYETSS